MLKSENNLYVLCLYLLVMLSFGIGLLIGSTEPNDILSPFIIFTFSLVAMKFLLDAIFNITTKEDN